jgi:hypothetical protein
MLADGCVRCSLTEALIRRAGAGAAAHCHTLWQAKLTAFGVRRCFLRENGTLFGVISLCLSRACLGKMIIYAIEWHRNGVFLPAKPVWLDQLMPSALERTIPVGLSFF